MTLVDTGNAMNKDELLPCPFCGSERLSVFHDDICRSCEILCECGCHICFSDDEIKEEELEKHVIEKWNTRTQCPECGKNQKAIKALLMNSEKLILVMQTAYVEMCNTGTDNAMLWIENNLDNIGSIPDVRKRTSAQEFFDEELAKLESIRRNEQ